MTKNAKEYKLYFLVSVCVHQPSVNCLKKKLINVCSMSVFQKISSLGGPIHGFKIYYIESIRILLKGNEYLEV